MYGRVAYSRVAYNTFIEISTAAAVSVVVGSNAKLYKPGLGPNFAFKPTLAFPSSGVIYSVSTVQGTYTLTGKPQTLNASRSISAVEGVYTLIGKPQTLSKGFAFSAAEGTYTVIGEPQTLNRGIGVSAVQGTYTQTGQTVTPQVGMPSTQGGYSLTGKPQSFAVALSTLIVKGSYGLTGNPQVLTYTKAGSSGQAQGHKFISDVGNMTEQNT